LEMIQLIPEFESNNEKFQTLIKINKEYSRLLNFHETWILNLGTNSSDSQSSSKQGA